MNPFSSDSDENKVDEHSLPSLSDAQALAGSRRLFILKFFHLSSIFLWFPLLIQLSEARLNPESILAFKDRLLKEKGPGKSVNPREKRRHLLYIPKKKP